MSTAPARSLSRSSRRPRRPGSAAALAAVLPLVALLAPAGAADEVDVVLGDRFRGFVESASDVDVLRFDAVAGTLLTASVKATFGLLPELELVDVTAGQAIDLSLFLSGAGGTKPKVKKLPLPSTGGYELRVGGVLGSTGLFDAKLTGKPPKTAKAIALVATPGGGADAVFPLSGVPGARFNATIKAAKGSGAVPTMPRLQEPTADGSETPLDAFVTAATDTKLVLKDVPLDAVGDFALLVHNGGAAGQLDAKIKVVFPKSKSSLTEDGIPNIGKGKGAVAGQVAVQEIPVLPEAEPNGLPSNANVVGTLAPGGVARLVGTVDDGGFPFSYDFSDFDGFRVVFDGSQDVSFILLHEVGRDFDVLFFDPGGVFGPPNGLLDITFLATELEPEAGILDLDLGGPLVLDVVVTSYEGSGAYLLSMISNPPAGTDDGGADAAAAAPIAQALAAGDGSALVARALRAVPAPAAPPPPRGVARRLTDRRLELDLPFVEGEFIVRLADPGRDPHAWAAERGLSVRRRSPAGHFVVRDPGALLGVDARARRERTVASKERVRQEPGVEYAELNELLAAFDTPNDQYYGLQWHYPDLNLPGAWAISQGSAGVLVAILDTGIFAHPDLTPRDTGFGYDMISDPQIAVDGNGVDPIPTDPGDGNGPQGTSSWHGTHVGGTVGARTDDGTGVAGVDWSCGLMFVRVLGAGGGTTFDIYEGVRYAAGLPNASGALPAQAADVINMSLGGGSPSQTGANAVAAARAAGVVVVAAAGNDNTSAPSYPAAYTGVISVAATDFQRNRAPYSNFGSTIDVAACGGDMTVDRNQDGYADGVLSTHVSESGGAPAPILGFQQGTSMAAPHVAGVCALILAVDPGATPDEVEALLETTAVDLGAPGFDTTYGHGLVDALAALQAAQGGGSGDPALAASTSSLAFGTQATALNVALVNTGGGGVTYTTAIQEFSGAGWLGVTNGSGSTPGSITVTVDRAAVPEGSYTGAVTVTGNGGAAGAAVIAVSMDKASGATGVVLDVGTVFVLAIDPEDLSTVGQGTATQGAPAYVVPDLPTGNWIILGGPDLDDDGFICGLGEPCGLFPVLNDAALVGVLPGLTRDGVDFPIADFSSLLGAAAGAGAGAGGANGASGLPFALPPQGLRVR